MSNSIWNQYFANEFTGIDGLTSSLEQDKGVNRAVNYEMAVGNSLRGRVGCQTSGSYGFFAIFPYRYTRTQDQYDIRYQVASGAYPNQTADLTTTKTTADGASIEKIIALNKQIWTLDTMNITISQTNPGDYTWYSYVSGSNINFVIKKDGVSILNTSLQNGLGLTAATTTTIYDLLDAIDGLADLSVSRTTRGTCPPFGIVNTNHFPATIGTTSYGTIRQVLLSSHNFQAGDIITFPPASMSSFVNGETLLGGVVISTVANTSVNYIGPGANLSDGKTVGYMGQSAASFPISTVSSETAGVFTLSMPYWRLIPEGDKDFGWIYDSAYQVSRNKTSSSFFAPPVAVNDSGNLYIAATGAVSAGDSTWANNLIKIDGTQASRAGLPGVALLSNAVGVGVLTGVYKYKAYLTRYDAQGNIIEGGPLDTTAIPPGGTYAGTTTPLTVTLTNNYHAINFGAFIEPDGQPLLYSEASGFLVRSCLKHTAEAVSVAGVPRFIYVGDTLGGVGLSAFVQPGDPICFLDNVTINTGGGGVNTGVWYGVGVGGTGIGTLHRTICTDYCAIAATISPTTSSIKLADTSNVTIPADSSITSGLTVTIVRTTAGGNQYYKLCEVPYSGIVNIAITDNVNDSILASSEQYIEPEIGKEYTPPPACTLVTQHQGGLVVARGPASPNTVGFSSASNIEHFPTASNSFDVPSTQSGFITAIASDTDDRLAVFKERAYYDVYGDLDGGSFSINVRNEGDYGITSQASLVRLPFGLCGLSKNGWVIISDGLLDPFRFQELNARIINQAYQFAWATAVNDYFNRQYICTIPQVSGEPVGFTIDYSRPRVKTFERSYATQIDQAGGCAMVGDTLYHLSATSPYGVFRRLARFDGNSPSGNGDGDSFIDNTGAISYILESQPINFNEPGQLKTPIRIRVWSLPNDYVEEGWVPFSLQVDTGASPIAAYVGSGFNNGTTGTMTFSTANDVFKDHKLVNCKTHFYIVRFTTNTIRTSPFITGYEILFKNNYAKEDLIK